MKIEIVKNGQYYYIRKKSFFEYYFLDIKDFWWPREYKKYATKFSSQEEAESCWKTHKEEVVKRLK